MIKKNPKADLRSKHTIFVQLGIIIALSFMIAATNMEMKPKAQPDLPVTKKFTTDTLTFYPPPIPPKKPAPHKPTILYVIPDDDPMDPDPIDFTDFEYAYGDSISLRPEPETDPSDDIITFAEFMPELKGGIKALYAEINYPKRAREARIEGRVIVEFVINKKGEVVNPIIIRGIGGGCDEEVLRAIKLMKFTPGIQNGSFVKVKMTQTITFKLQN